MVIASSDLHFMFSLKMEELKNGKVHMKHPEQVEEKISKLISGGKDKLQVNNGIY